MSAFIDSGHDRGWWVLAALSYFETSGLRYAFGKNRLTPVFSSETISAQSHPLATPAFNSIRSYIGHELSKISICNNHDYP
jgi:hypothetical protein